MKQRSSIPAFSVIVTFVAISLLGMAAIPFLPVKVAPSATLPAVTVSFGMPGSPAQVVEKQVTSAIEGTLARMAGVSGIESRSRNGGGYVRLELDGTTDPADARFEASVLVRQLWSSFPPEVSYPEVAVESLADSEDTPFMLFSVNAPDEPADIMDFAARVIRPKLTGIAGINEIRLSGAEPARMLFTYDCSALDRYGLSAADVARAVAEYGRTGKTDIPLGSATSAGGRIITLADVTTAAIEQPEARSYSRVNGHPAVLIAIVPERGVNQIELSRRIREATDAMTLPQGYSILLNYDASESMLTELSKVYFRSGLTVLILLIFVGLITLSFRYLLLITISLAVTLAISFGAFYFFGVEIQMFSLAGITISLNLVIDNLVVMTEHLRRHRNRGAFPAILSATLTTVAALAAIFFLDRELMLTLRDFALTVIITLAVSLVTALFFVPALAQTLGMTTDTPESGDAPTPRSLAARRIYTAMVAVVVRFRIIVWIAFAALTLWAFHIFYHSLNNGTNIFGAESNNNIRVNVSMPDGSTVARLDAVLKDLESTICASPGVSLCHTSVSGPRKGTINIYFTTDAQHSSQPFSLREKLVEKALATGGAAMQISGPGREDFNNEFRESAGASSVKLTGYNYDELCALAAQLSDTLVAHPRIREVTISADESYWKDDHSEFYLDFNHPKLSADSISATALFDLMRRSVDRGSIAGMALTTSGTMRLALSSNRADDDLWHLMNTPLLYAGRYIKPADYVTMERRPTPSDIVKANQEYIIYLRFEFVGDIMAAKRMLERKLKAFNNSLPAGYKAKDETPYTLQPESIGSWAILIIVVIAIFFIAAILFNSLRQPPAIIAVIPVAVSGVFFTYSILNLQFDRGGVAALVLLSGIAVNAALYIVCEFNNLRARQPHTPDSHLFAQAAMSKLRAIFLTVLSTVLGFIPFLIGRHETFWYTMATGTMGGLLLSLPAVFILLPSILVKKK